MAKKVKNLIKRLGKSYLEGYMRMYGPVIEAGCNPFMF